MNTAPAHSAGYYLYFARMAHRTGRNFRREGRVDAADDHFADAAAYVLQAREALFEELCATPDRVLYPQTELPFAPDPRLPETPLED